MQFYRAREDSDLNVRHNQRTLLKISQGAEVYTTKAKTADTLDTPRYCVRNSARPRGDAGDYIQHTVFITMSSPDVTVRY